MGIDWENLFIRIACWKTLVSKSLEKTYFFTRLLVFRLEYLCLYCNIKNQYNVIDLVNSIKPLKKIKSIETGSWIFSHLTNVNVLWIYGSCEIIRLFLQQHYVAKVSSYLSNYFYIYSTMCACWIPVSYTHLDVYKRQVQFKALN